MATVQELSAALVKADAAGDTAGAKTLADAIRGMQGQGDAAPAADTPAAPAAGQPSLLGSTVATLNHAVTDLPIVGAPLQWLGDNLAAQTVGRLEGQDPAVWLKNAQASREANDAANPIAAAAGGIGGNVAATIAAGGSNLGGEALGFTGKLLPSIVKGSIAPGKIVASGLSQLGLGTVDNMEKGQAPTEAMTNAAGPAAVAAGVPVVAAGVGKVIDSAGGAIDAARQRAAINAAIAGAPDAAALKASASQAFDASTGGKPVAISGPAYGRFMADIKGSLGKFRPNAQNDPQTVGLLQHLSDLEAAANTSGTVVDLKDLHLARQLAGQVAQSPGRDGAMGSIVVRQLDDFIQGLKPSDILGGSDPRQAANDLMTGISTWNRAIKVGVIQKAIQDADAYKSGTENGLKSTFSNLMKSDDFSRFTAQEKAAIREVAKGTTMQNALSLVGKLGFAPGGTASHNIIGGTIGLGLGSAALTPILGPVAAPAVSAGASMAASAAARRAAEGIGLNSANRAAQIAATPNIPTVAPMIMPPLLRQAPHALELTVRGALARQ